MVFQSGRGIARPSVPFAKAKRGPGGGIVRPSPAPRAPSRPGAPSAPRAPTPTITDPMARDPAAKIRREGGGEAAARAARAASKGGASFEESVAVGRAAAEAGISLGQAKAFSEFALKEPTEVLKEEVPIRREEIIRPTTREEFARELFRKKGFKVGEEKGFLTIEKEGRKQLISGIIPRVQRATGREFIEEVPTIRADLPSTARFGPSLKIERRPPEPEKPFFERIKEKVPISPLQVPQLTAQLFAAPRERRKEIITGELEKVKGLGREVFIETKRFVEEDVITFPKRLKKKVKEIGGVKPFVLETGKELGEIPLTFFKGAVKAITYPGAKLTRITGLEQKLEKLGFESQFVTKEPFFKDPEIQAATGLGLFIAGGGLFPKLIPKIFTGIVGAQTVATIKEPDPENIAELLFLVSATKPGRKIIEKFPRPGLGKIDIPIGRKTIVEGVETIPTKTIFKGVTFRAGAKEFPVVGITEKGIRFGAPDILPSLKKIPKGQEKFIASALETEVFRKSLRRDKELSVVTKRAREFIKPTRDILISTQLTRAKIRGELPRVTERLPERGVREILRLGREERGVLFGSFPRQPKLLREFVIKGKKFKLTKVPRDIEFRFDLADEIELQRITELGVKRLRKVGIRAREIKDSPFSIEAKTPLTKGKFKKVVEFKGSLEDVSVPEFVLGIKKTGKLTKIEKLQTTKLREELRGVAQGIARIRKTEKGLLDIFPPPKREKDIGSFVVSARSLLARKVVRKGKLRRDIEKFETLFPEKLIREQLRRIDEVKVPLADFGRVPKRKAVVSPFIQPIPKDISISPSFSRSVKRVTSLSKSISKSISQSISPSISKSISKSLSPSISPSLSKSISKSLSPSISVSISKSISKSISQSISPSISKSISKSLSQSLSPSISPSLSKSISKSLSPTITPVEPSPPSPPIMFDLDFFIKKKKRKKKIPKRIFRKTPTLFDIEFGSLVPPIPVSKEIFTGGEVFRFPKKKNAMEII